MGRTFQDANLECNTVIELSGDDPRWSRKLHGDEVPANQM